MIWFICAESFLSNCAIISSIVSSTSDLTRLESASACATSVLTAFSTSVAARSVRGLKLCFSSTENSSASRVSTRASSGARAVVVSVAITTSSGYRLRSGFGFAFIARFRSTVLHRFHELRVGQQFAQRVFCRDLAVHVALQVGKLLPRLEELGERRHLPRYRGWLEVGHFVEAQTDAHLVRGSISQLVIDLEADAGLNGRHASIQIVHIEIEELAIGNFLPLDPRRVSGQIGHDPHDERDFDLFLRVIRVLVSDVHPRRTISLNEFLTAVSCHVCSPLVRRVAPAAGVRESPPLP